MLMLVHALLVVVLVPLMISKLVMQRRNPETQMIVPMAIISTTTVTHAKRVRPIV